MSDANTDFCNENTGLLVEPEATNTDLAEVEKLRRSERKREKGKETKRKGEKLYNVNRK